MSTTPNLTELLARRGKPTTPFNSRFVFNSQANAQPNFKPTTLGDRLNQIEGGDPQLNDTQVAIVRYIQNRQDRVMRPLR